jgi:hypothetical protein
MIARYTRTCDACRAITSPTILRGEVVLCLDCCRRMALEAELASRPPARVERTAPPAVVALPEDAGVMAGEE